MRIRGTILCLILGALTTGCDDDSHSPRPCEYPDGAPADFVVEETLREISWPVALDATGSETTLDMRDVFCNEDDSRSWRETRYLLFVAFPAWGPTSVNHVRDVISIESSIDSLDAEIVWVLQADSSAGPGTAASCHAFMEQLGASGGVRVGDDEMLPEANLFENSILALGRGTDMYVRRSDMEIVFATNHGSPAGNENLTGQELLAALRGFH